MTRAHLELRIALISTVVHWTPTNAAVKRLLVGLGPVYIEVGDPRWVR